MPAYDWSMSLASNHMPWSEAVDDVLATPGRKIEIGADLPFDISETISYFPTPMGGLSSVKSLRTCWFRPTTDLEIHTLPEWEIFIIGLGMSF